MEINDIWWDTGILSVRLPEPEIFIATLDNDKSYVFDRDTGLLTRGDINLETTARQAAEDEIEKAALEDGILEMAKVNAESYLYRLFRSMDISEVVFVHETFISVITSVVAPESFISCGARTSEATISSCNAVPMFPIVSLTMNDILYTWSDSDGVNEQYCK